MKCEINLLGVQRFDEGTKPKTEKVAINYGFTN
jgi:hypothetical protein